MLGVQLCCSPIVVSHNSSFSGKQFDVAGAILSSLKGLKVDLAIEATLKLDQCNLIQIFSSCIVLTYFLVETELLFDQRSIPVMVSS